MEIDFKTRPTYGDDDDKYIKTRKDGSKKKWVKENIRRKGTT